MIKKLLVLTMLSSVVAFDAFGESSTTNIELSPLSDFIRGKVDFGGPTNQPVMQELYFTNAIVLSIGPSDADRRKTVFHWREWEKTEDMPATRQERILSAVKEWQTINQMPMLTVSFYRHIYFKGILSSHTYREVTLVLSNAQPAMAEDHHD